MSHPDGGSVFPVPCCPLCQGHAHVGVQQKMEGCSLRDLFAAAALQGFLASQHKGWSGTRENTVAFAYQYADAMLKKREQQS